MCGWRVRSHPDGTWICPEEKFEGRLPSLFRLDAVADATSAAQPERYEILRRWTPQDPAISRADPLETLRTAEELTQDHTLENYWVRFRLRFMTLPDAQIPDYARPVFTDVAELHKGATLWAVGFTERLKNRLATIRALFAASQDPDFLSRPREILLFPGAQGLLRSQMYGFPAYVEPALLIASPWLLGMSSYRHGGSLVVLFGESVPGFRPVQAPELVNILRPLAFPSTPSRSFGRPVVETGQDVAVLAGGSKESTRCSRSRLIPPRTGMPRVRTTRQLTWARSSALSAYSTRFRACLRTRGGTTSSGLCSSSMSWTSSRGCNWVDGSSS